MIGGFEDGWASRRGRIFLPPAPEICDGKDSDCNGATPADEADDDDSTSSTDDDDAIDDSDGDDDLASDCQCKSDQAPFAPVAALTLLAAMGLIVIGRRRI